MSAPQRRTTRRPITRRLATRRPATRRLAGLLLAAAAAAGGACGISADDQPRALPVTPTTTVPTTTTTPGGSASAVLWYVDDQELVPVPRSLPDRSLGTALGALLDAGVDPGGGRSTSIPAGTQLRELALEDGVLGVDLTGSFAELAGTARQLAIAQLVLTATEDPGVDEVTFLVDGEPVLASSPERGDVATVTDCDFLSLLAGTPTDDGGATGGEPDDSAERLGRRVAELEERCATG